MSASQRNRDSAEIEADLDQTRARMTSTLDALQNKFTPGELLNDALSYFRNRGSGEFASNLGDSVKNNPMPIALVGIGLAWLAMSGSEGSSPSEFDDTTDYGDPRDPDEVFAEDSEAMSAELTAQPYGEAVGSVTSDPEADSEPVGAATVTKETQVYGEPDDSTASDEVVGSEAVVVSTVGDEDPVDDQTQETTSRTRVVSQDQDADPADEPIRDTTSGTRGASQDEDETLVRRI